MGIAINRDTAAAISFLVFNILNNTKIHHKNAIEMTAILIPIGKIKSLTLIRFSSTYRKGTINTLIAIMVASTPFPPNLITGKNTSQAKIIELIGKSDHVKAPEIAISQIEQAIMPINRSKENTIAQISCKDFNLFFTVLFA